MVKKIEDQTLSIDKAEKVLNDLQAKHSRLVARGVEIGDERANIAYQAHATGDAKAEKRLAKLHREAAEHASLLERRRESSKNFSGITLPPLG
jgi:hypothetical protein